MPKPPSSPPVKILSFFFLYLLIGETFANQIPLGLNGNGKVFIQEYWLGENPSYCLSNHGETDLIIQVSRWQSRQLPSIPLDKWHAPAGTARCYDAKAYQKEWLLEFKQQDGNRLGLLKTPRQPPIMNIKQQPVVSYQNLNASCRALPDMWIEQQKLWGQSGEPLFITLQASTNVGKIEFDKTDNDDYIAIKNITSSTLPINKDGSRIVIDTKHPKKNQNYHQVNIQLDTPLVSKPTMFFVSGRRQVDQEGWQCFIRGILIKPSSFLQNSSVKSIN